MNSQIWLSMSFSAFFFTWGIFLPYWTCWLTIEKGLFVTAASFITGAGMIARSLSFHTWSLICVMKWTSLAALILTLLYLPDTPFIVLFTITVLFSTVYPMILLAIESGASVLMQTEGIHYGKSHQFQSSFRLAKGSASCPATRSPFARRA